MAEKIPAKIGAAITAYIDIFLALINPAAVQTVINNTAVIDNLFLCMARNKMDTLIINRNGQKFN
jgi:hypothetical protein